MSLSLALALIGVAYVAGVASGAVSTLAAQWAMFVLIARTSLSG